MMLPSIRPRAPTLDNALMGFCDAALAECRQLEDRIERDGIAAGALETLYGELHQASHRSAEALVDLLNGYGGRPVWPDAARILQSHDLHRHVLLRSAFIRQAFEKPYGYAGDKDLMEIIYNNEDLGAARFDVLANRVYQSLPAAQAVRDRATALAGMIRALPDGSRVLSVACGSAREVRDVLADAGRRRISFDLVDHDSETIRFTRKTIPDQSVTHIVGNAYEIIKGRTKFKGYRRTATTDELACDVDISSKRYDLVYSAGLYDYISHFPFNANRGVTALTAKLLSLLEPGGRLIVGNFLKPMAHNPHVKSHMLMMELYSSWSLFYRAPYEILEFSQTCPSAELADVVLTGASMRPEEALSGPIGYLHLTRR